MQTALPEVFSTNSLSCRLGRAHRAVYRGPRGWIEFWNTFRAAAEAAWLHTVRDGLVVGLRTFASWDDALEAAGLRV